MKHAGTIIAVVIVVLVIGGAIYYFAGQNSKDLHSSKTGDSGTPTK